MSFGMRVQQGFGLFRCQFRVSIRGSRPVQAAFWWLLGRVLDGCGMRLDLIMLVDMLIFGSSKPKGYIEVRLRGVTGLRRPVEGLMLSALAMAEVPMAPCPPLWPMAQLGTRPCLS